MRPIAYTEHVNIPVYRTERGMILRVIEAEDGGLKVELLSGDDWVAGRIGMVGLRLSPSTTQLSPEEAKLLPE
jgi:hypothetical protein